MSVVAKVQFVDYEESVARALDLIGAAARLPQCGLIIIKPNLTNAAPPPVTTPVEAVEALCNYCALHSKAEVAIGEGCGSGTTKETFDANGYTTLAKRLGIRLIDFNEEKAVLLKNKNAPQLKELYLPEIAIESFIISVPILKDHSFTKTTIAMKNMFGLAPAPYYRGNWNKSKLHSPSTHQSVVDVCTYRKPDLSVVDAVVALTGMHLAGTPKRLNTILASFDPVSVDAIAGELIGHDRKDVKYLVSSNGVLGNMNDVEIRE
jgi:uncharacterized protein (DUF362 family)